METSGRLGRLTALDVDDYGPRLRVAVPFYRKVPQSLGGSARKQNGTKTHERSYQTKDYKGVEERFPFLARCDMDKHQRDGYLRSNFGRRRDFECDPEPFNGSC